MRNKIEIDLWSWPLDADDDSARRMQALLSADERERAGRFHFERDQRRYAMGRGRLRRILADYAGRQPEQLRFVYGPNGKPALCPKHHENRPHFNLSHSQHLACLAVCASHEIGVDIECVRPIEPQVAELYFSAHENRALAQLPEPVRLDGFYRLWTLKEAFLKAGGDGLSTPLDSFDIDFQADRPPRLLRLAGDREAPKRWRLLSFSPAKGFHGALALKSDGAELSLQQRQQLE